MISNFEEDCMIDIGRPSFFEDSHCDYSLEI